jgi:hypothetical protein
MRETLRASVEGCETACEGTSSGSGGRRRAPMLYSCGRVRFFCSDVDLTHDCASSGQSILVLSRRYNWRPSRDDFSSL